MLFVFGLLYGLGFEGIQKSNAVAADVVSAAFGPFGITLVGAGVAVATLTSINATMLVGARTNYALGRDWPIVSFMSRWHGERDAPVRAFLVQAVLALALIVLGAVETDGFKTMVEFTAPVFWLFFLLTAISVFILRFKYPHVSRPFRVPLYPILPLAFIATCAYLLYSSVTYAQSQKAVHVSFYVMGAGVVAWIIARLKRGS
jgi:amino acid transporter